MYAAEYFNIKRIIEDNQPITLFHNYNMAKRS